MSSERLNRRGEGGSNSGNMAERKTSLYFKGNTLQEIQECAARLDRSVSWVIQRAWALSKDQLAHMPSMSDVGDEPTAETDVDLND